MREARRRTLSTPGSTPEPSKPRSMHSFITDQICSSAARVSDSGRNARSFASTSSCSSRPWSRAMSSSSCADANWNGTSTCCAPTAALPKSAARTMKPPPVEKYSSRCSTSPAASSAVNRMPFGCCGSVWSRWNSRSSGSSNAISVSASRGAAGPCRGCARAPVPSPPARSSPARCPRARAAPRDRCSAHARSARASRTSAPRPCRCARAVPARLEIAHERAGRVHRPHRVGARRADADLEDVEDAEVQVSVSSV